jgi:hypothetical protein
MNTEQTTIATRSSHHSRPRLNGFEVYLMLRECIEKCIPTSMIRLGDGEAAVMGFPEVTTRDEVDRSWMIWLGDTEVSDSEVSALAKDLRTAISQCDILGLPRQKQRQAFHLYEKVYTSIDQFGLLSERHRLADAAIHRYLQFALLYRPLLRNLPFLGIISSKSIGDVLRNEFSIQSIVHYPIRGESTLPGPIQERHFPDTFNRLREALEVPFPGAVFLVGAGVFGKIYCQWIKERGGIALDVGSMCDPWARSLFNASDRALLRAPHPVHFLDLYQELPVISAEDAINRYNKICAQLNIDAAIATIESSYFSQLEPSW